MTDLLPFETYPMIGSFLDETIYGPMSYRYYTRELGEWELLVTEEDIPINDIYPPGGIAYKIGNHHIAGGNYRSVDLENWQRISPITSNISLTQRWPVYYKGKPYIVAINITTGALYKSSNFGYSFTLITKPDGDEWLLGKVLQNGEIHLRNTAEAQLRYAYSSDLGETWVIRDQGGIMWHPQPWVGGEIHQTSGRNFSYPTVHASGDKVVIACMENWTEQYYINGYNVEHAQFPGPHYRKNITQRYTPTDLIINISYDRGATWIGPVRYKNDQNQTLDGGATLAWGGSSPHGMGTIVGYPEWAPLSFPAQPQIVSYNGDLYIFALLYEIYKKMAAVPAP